MQSNKRVVIVGGGLLGCSLLYFLAKRGWRDLLLIEQDELTSGTTWHSVALCTHYIAAGAMIPFHLRTTQIYEGLEAATGHATGYRKVGSLRLATREEQLKEYRRYLGRARHVGVRAEIVSAAEAKAMHPLIVGDDIVGAVWTPEDGYTDPSQTTHAFANGARALGAEIRRFTRMEELTPRAAGGWDIATDHGPIAAETVVLSPGMWTGKIAARLGVTLPVVPMERQYLVTGDIAAIKALDGRLPVLRDPSNRFTARQEHSGLICGLNDREGEAPIWGLDGIPARFSHGVLPTNLDRVSDSLEGIARRLPAASEAGIRKVFCGPTSRTPDQIGLVGPLPGHRDLFVFGAFTAGFTEGPAVAELLAEWIVDGEPSRSLAAFDLRRFGPHMDKYAVAALMRESHTHGLEVAYPNSVRKAGRPVRTTPIYDRQSARGARFIAANGWECADVFVPEGTPASETPSFGRPDFLPHVVATCAALRRGAGVIDLSSMAKFEVSGAGAAAALDAVLANALPTEDGGIVPAPLLTERGGMLCHFMLARIDAQRFYLTAAASAETHHFDCLRRALPATLRVDNVTTERGVLLLTGPRAGEIMATLSDGQIDARLPARTLHALRMRFTPVEVMRLDATGEGGFEIHHPLAHQLALYEAIQSIGAPLGLVDAGMRSFDTLRLDRLRPRWGFELGMTTTPLEARLESSVALDKGAFPGREALRRQASEGPSRLLCAIALDAPPDGYWAWGGEPVFHGDRSVALVTSVAFSPRRGGLVALAYLPRAASAIGTKLAIQLLDRRVPAEVIRAPARVS